MAEHKTQDKVYSDVKHAAQSGRYFSALDGYRGSLSLVVAVYHTIWLSNINQTAFFNNGPVIIDLFFGLSGFLMFLFYSDKIVDGQSALTYLKRRVARLYPLHLFTLFLVLAYSLFRIFIHNIGFAEHETGEILPFQAGAIEGWNTLLTNILLIHSLGVHDYLSFNVPSWTISVEFYAYIFFVCLMLFLKPKTARHYYALAAFAFLIYASLSHLKPDMNITYDYGGLRCLAGFILGGVAAFAHQQLNNRVEILPRYIKTFVEVVTVIGCTLFIIYCPGKLQFFFGIILFVFILVFSFDGGWVSKFMSAPIFGYLAKISYSVYMMHFIIAIGFGIVSEKIGPHILGLNWNATGLGGDLLILPYLVVVICVSHLTQKYVEVPGGKLIMGLKMPRRVTRK